MENSTSEMNVELASEEENTSVGELEVESVGEMEVDSEVSILSKGKRKNRIGEPDERETSDTGPSTSKKRMTSTLQRKSTDDIKAFYKDVKETLPKEMNCYIPHRFISRRIISPDIFRKIEDIEADDVFLIRSTTKAEFSKLVDEAEIETSSKIMESTKKNTPYNIILLENMDHVQKMREIFVTQPLHILSYENDELIWQKTFGDIRNIHETRKDIQQIQDAMAFLGDMISQRSSERYPICLSSPPGMQTSEILSNLARNLRITNKNGMLFFIVMKEFISCISNIKRSPVETSDEGENSLDEGENSPDEGENSPDEGENSPDEDENSPDEGENSADDDNHSIFSEDNIPMSYSHDDIFSGLVSYLCINESGQSYLKTNKHLINELLFDGFDDLDTNDIQIAYEILSILDKSFKGTRIWVITAHMTDRFERKFGVLGYDIKPIELQDQVNYLKSYWSLNNSGLTNTENLAVFAKCCLISVQDKMFEWGQDETNVQLQCLLIREAFEEAAIKFGRDEQKSKSEEIDVEVEAFSSVGKLFHEVVHKQIDKAIRMSQNQSIDTTDLINWHMYTAIRNLFPNSHQTFKSILCAKNVSDEQLLHVGLLYSNPNSKCSFEFVHNAFAEYLVAKFIVESLCKNTVPSNFDYVNNFFNKHLLETISIEYKVQQLTHRCRDFTQKDICCFINTLLAEMPADFPPLNIPQNNVIHVSEACIYNNFEHIFVKYVHPNVLKFNYKEKVFTERVLKLSAFRGSAHLFEKVFNLFSTQYSFSITHITQKDYTLLHLAVICGNYELVNILLDKENFLKEDDKRFHNLLHDCAQNSKSIPGNVLKNKCLILGRLIEINENLLYYENERKKLPIEVPDINFKLALKLLQRGGEQYVENGYVTRILCQMTQTLNNNEYAELIQTFFSGNEQIVCKMFVNCIYNQTTIVEEIFRLMNPDTKLLNILQKYETNFKPLTRKLSVIRLAMQKQGNVDCLKWLLKNVKWSDSELIELIELPLPESNLHTVLEDKHVHLNIKLKGGKTILHYLCQYRTLSSIHLDITQKALEQDVESNLTDDNNTTPIEYLIMNECTSIRIRILNLLYAKVPTTVSDDLVHKMFIWVYDKLNGKNSGRILHLFNRTLKDSNGNTLLHYALEQQTENKKQCMEIVRFCPEFINASNNFGETPLHILTKYMDSSDGWVRRSFKLESWKILIDQNANPWTMDKAKNMPIFQLLLNCAKRNISVGSAEALKYVWTSGNLWATFSNQHVKDTDGNTLLHLAVQTKSYSLLNWILAFKSDTRSASLGLDINAVNKFGQTPLHLLALDSVHFIHCWKLLISNKANPWAIEKDGKTPICNLIENADENLFISAVSCVNKLNERIPNNLLSNRNSILHAAAYRGNKKILEYVFGLYADVRAVNSLSQTPLHLTVKHLTNIKSVRNVNLTAIPRPSTNVIPRPSTNVIPRLFTPVIQRPLTPVIPGPLPPSLPPVLPHDLASTRVPADTPPPPRPHSPPPPPRPHSPPPPPRNLVYGSVSTNRVSSLGVYNYMQQIAVQGTINRPPLVCPPASPPPDFSLDSWMFLLDKNSDILTFDIFNETPICRLRYVRRSTQYVLLAILSALNTIRSNRSVVEQIIWLIVKNFKLEIIRQVCQWYTVHFTKSLNDIKIENMGTILDAAFYDVNSKQEGGCSIEYLIYDMKCTSTGSNLPSYSIFKCMESTSIDINRRVKILEVLVQNNSHVNVNCPDEHGIVPLSSRDCDAEFVQFLIKQGADVKARDILGNTPLHWAFKYNLPIQKLFCRINELLNCGADINAVNQNLETPLQLALKFYSWPIVCVLTEKNADLNLLYSSRDSFLHLIADSFYYRNKNSFNKVLEYLMKRGDWDLFKARNDYGLTPLQVARKHGIEIDNGKLEILREHGVNIEELST